MLFDHVVCFITMLLFQNHRRLHFRIFKGQKSLILSHKNIKCVWCMGSYATLWEHSFAILDISVSCGTARHPTREVWPDTPHNHLLFSYNHTTLLSYTSQVKHTIQNINYPWLVAPKPCQVNVW